MRLLIRNFGPLLTRFTLLWVCAWGLCLEAKAGSQDEARAEAIHKQALELIKAAKYSDALPLVQQALEIRKHEFGLRHHKTAESLGTLGLLYLSVGKTAQAEPLCRQALTISEEVSGSVHTNTAAALINLGTLYKVRGEYTEAEPLFRRAVQIYEKAPGAPALDLARAINNLGSFYETMGEFAKAEPLYQRSLQLREESAGPEDLDTATGLNNLAELYARKGEYAKALPLLQRAVKIGDKAPTPNPSIQAANVGNLADLYFHLADYAQAQPLYERALHLIETALGPEHPRTATCLQNLGTFFHAMQDYAQAERLYLRALKIKEQALGAEHPETAVVLNNLAELYRAVGDYAQAEPLYRKALMISEKSFGPEHPLTADALNNLATVYRKSGAYTQAESLLERSLRIREKVVGPEHPEIAQTLNNLGELYFSTGHYAKAEPLFQRALKITETSLNPEHPNAATYLNNLAALYEKESDYRKAEAFYQRALRNEEKNFGFGHPRTTLCLRNLALLLLNEGRPAEALQMAAEAERANLKSLENILSFTSESQRLAFMQGFDPYSLLASLGSSPELAQAILHCKGVVLDSLTEDRLVAQTSANPHDRELMAQLRSAKQHAYRLTLEGPGSLRATEREQYATARREAQSEVLQLEAELARRVGGLGRARRALSVTVEEVQAALPRQAALVEFVRYWHFLGHHEGQSRYGALILPAAGPPKWVSLGPASALSTNIALYQAGVRIKAPDRAFSRLLTTLHHQLWEPVERELPADTKTVIISPDAALNLVSFATLLTKEDRFLAQKYSIRYVSTGRDLLRQASPPTSQEMVIFANPDFSAQGSATTVQNSEERKSAPLAGTPNFLNRKISPLPGTSEECALLQKEAAKWNLAIKTFEGTQASEAQLSNVHSPRILHFATHGFFFPNTDNGPGAKNTKALGQKAGSPPGAQGRPEASDKRFLFQNPMHRSGLLLAGAQSTLEHWKQGQVPAPENDGILTAEEVSSLQLQGTWLVTLSACDTASGETRPGEGVLGLRRGFVQAGAQNLLMTLWPTRDAEAAAFMVDFYAAAQQSGNASQALAQVQAHQLQQLRTERGLVEAVQIAGPFILSSQGKMD